MIIQEEVKIINILKNGENLYAYNCIHYEYK